MAYSEQLAERVARILQHEGVDFLEKKMFGGVAFMINDKMCVGIVKDELMLRVMDDMEETVEKMDGVRPMDMTGKRMKGFYFIESSAMQKDSELKKWVDMGVEFGIKGVLKTKKKK